MRRILDWVYQGSLVVAGMFLFGVFALMIGESAFRSLGSYITGANELVGWFCAAAGFLALPATFKHGDMVRVGFGLDALPPAARKAGLVACLVVGTVFVGYMTWAAGRYLYGGWKSQELTQGMILIPVWIPQLSFLAGALLLFVAFVDELVVTLRADAATLRAEHEFDEADIASSPV
jgi:TRAP-type C4-dicarboxylate transport system permease small subunit